MVTFVICLILLGCGAFHVYLYRKINAAYSIPLRLRKGLRLFFVVMVLAPLLNRLLDFAGYAVLSRTLNFPVFIWAAWMFWFFVGGMAIDLWNILLPRTPFGLRLTIPVRRQVAGLFILIVITTAWSLHEAFRPRVVTTPLHTPLLEHSQPIRIVQVSDVHLGMLRNTAWTRMVCGIVASLKPDLLVSTGDLVDTSLSAVADQAALWAELHPPLGKYAVLGNHEYYLGLPDSLAFHEKAGFRLLRSESVEIGSTLFLAGVDDKDGLRLGRPCFCDERSFTNRVGAPRYAILLKHRPTLTTNSVARFDLQLSGHTHNGQLFPFKTLVRLNHRFTHGLYQITPGFLLSVSAGAGTWGPPMRLLAPPEINLFILSGSSEKGD